MAFADVWAGIVKGAWNLLGPGVKSPGGNLATNRVIDSAFGTGSARPYKPPTPDFWKNLGGNNLPPTIPTPDRGGDRTTTEQILEQLKMLQDPSRYLGNMGDYSSMARSAAEAQYGPQIRELQRARSSTEQRGNQNREILGQIFNQLAGSIEQDVPDVQKYYADTKANTNKQYEDLQKSIGDTYAKSQADQEEMYKRLNIQAAASETLPQQQTDRDFFINQAKQKQATMADSLTQEETGAVNYTNTGVTMAKREGPQRQADLMSQMMEMLGAYDAKISDVSAAKEQAYNSLLGEYQMKAQENALKRAQQDFNNFIAMTNLGRGLRRDEMDIMSIFDKKNTPVKGISDVASRALGFGLPESSAQNLQNVFQSAIFNPDIMSGLDANTGSSMTPEAMASLIMEAGRNQGMSSAELNALQAIALEYFGRR